MYSLYVGGGCFSWLGDVWVGLLGSVCVYFCET